MDGQQLEAQEFLCLTEISKRCKPDWLKMKRSII